MEGLSMQINITELALETLKRLLANDKNKQAVYIYLAGIGCGGGGKASFSLMPVNQKEDENVLEIEDITFIYDRLILFHTKNILIDYSPSAYDQEIRIESFIIKDAK
jgi:Fe-S cluster assembly iron-binding protein IscA